MYTGMDWLTGIRLEELRGESKKREILRREGIHWETLRKILAHPEPPGYRLLESAVATSMNQITLTWSPGVDNVTRSANLTYLVYMATSSGAKTFPRPLPRPLPGQLPIR